MTFEEVLPALKAGKSVKRKYWVKYIWFEIGSFWYKYDDGQDYIYDLTGEDAFADDWEIVE